MSVPGVHYLFAELWPGMGTLSRTLKEVYGLVISQFLAKLRSVDSKKA